MSGEDDEEEDAEDEEEGEEGRGSVTTAAKLGGISMLADGFADVSNVCAE